MGLYINPLSDQTSRSKRETILAVAKKVSIGTFIGSSKVTAAKTLWGT